eukprot:366027-Chlamydomonas_euryale.AAC.6
MGGCGVHTVAWMSRSRRSHDYMPPCMAVFMHVFGCMAKAQAWLCYGRGVHGHAGVASAWPC